MSEIALRPMLAATMMSSCLQLLPAATALAVACVMGLVHLTIISGVPVQLPCCSIERSAWRIANKALLKISRYDYNL